jgi:hypothetical protein
VKNNAAGFIQVGIYQLGEISLEVDDAFSAAIFMHCSCLERYA